MNDRATVPFEDYRRLEIEIDDLKEHLEEANLEIKRLNQMIIDIEEDKKDNYRRIDDMSLYGLKDSDYR